MGNALDQERVETLGQTQWTLSFDCRPHVLAPFLFCHSKRVILSPKDVSDLVGIASSDQMSKPVDRFCDLPPFLLPRAACLRASQYLVRDRIHVPSDRDAAGIDSVPISGAMALYDTNFGRLLIQIFARARRIQLDVVGTRVRRALQSNSGGHGMDDLRLKLVSGYDDVTPPSSLKRLTTLIDRELKLKSKSLITESIAFELESLPVGELSAAFIAATSSSIKQDATVKYLVTFWDYLCAASSYSSISRMLATDAKYVASFCRILVAFAAVTTSFAALIQAASTLMLISATDLRHDFRLPWQVSNSLNRVRRDAADPVNKNSPPLYAGAACIEIIALLSQRSIHQGFDAGFDPSALAALLQLLCRCVYSFFARVKDEDAEGEIRWKVRALQGPLPSTLSDARALLRVCDTIASDPALFRTLHLSNITKNGDALRLLESAGFSSLKDGYMEADCVQVEPLRILRCELQLFIQQIWSDLVPDLLRILHDQLLLIARHRTHPAPRDLKRKDLFSSIFDDLLRVVALGFDQFEKSPRSYRFNNAILAIRVLCDGMPVFLPKASQQVSFLSRIFDYTMPLTPSSTFKRDFTLTAPARSAISCYIFCHSQMIKDVGYLTDLAFGQDEDIWSELISEIKNSAPEGIAWRRVCRVLVDAQSNDAEYLRYKNDPVISPILNAIMRADQNDVAPLKMGVIHEALVRFAIPFPDLLQDREQIETPGASDGEDQRFLVSQRSAQVLFCFQRDLFQRSILDGSRIDAHRNHPALELGRTFLQLTLQKVTDLCDSSGRIRTRDSALFRESLLGGFLPHILLGLAAVVPQFHPENASLANLHLQAKSLHQLLGGHESLDSECLRPYCSASETITYDYADVESILDAGSAIHDLLIHPMLDLDSAHDTDRPERIGAARDFMRTLLHSRHASPALVAHFDRDSDVVLELLSALQKDHHTLDVTLQQNETLRWIVSELVFNAPDMKNLLEVADMPSLYLCPLCGVSCPRISDLVLHALGRASYSQPSSMICNPSNASQWLQLVRHQVVFLLAKIARKLVSGAPMPSAASSSNHRTDAEFPLTSESNLNETGREWLRSVLFNGGFDGTDVCSQTPNDGSAICVPMNPSEHHLLFDNLMNGCGAAGSLNEAILKLTQFRLFAHRRSGGDAIAHATRMIVAALVKHSGLTAEVRALADSITDDTASDTLLQPAYAPVLKLWAAADSLKAYWVLLHQDGIQSICLEPLCKQSVVFESGAYRCGNGHEHPDCETIDTAPYTQICDQIRLKCEFLLETESASRLSLRPTFLRQTSVIIHRLLRHRSLDQTSPAQSPAQPASKWDMVRSTFRGIRAQSRPMKTAKLHRSINDAVVDFLKDDRVDVRSLRKSLQSLVYRARSRAHGFDLFASLLQRAPPSLLLVAVHELVAAQRDLSSSADQIGAHFLDTIESAGVSMLSAVRRSYAMVAVRIASLLSDTICEFSAGSARDQSLFLLLLFDFWKMGFSSGDFALLRGLNLVRIIRAALSLPSALIQCGARRLANAIGLVCFAPDRNPAMDSVSTSHLDPFQISLLDDMLHDVSRPWPPSSERAYALHEASIFDIFVVLTLACNISSVKLLEYLRSNTAWISTLILYVRDGLCGESRELSPRLLRRVTTLATMIFPHVHPDQLTQVWFDLPDATPANFFERLIRIVGRYSCGHNQCSAVLPQPLSSTWAMLRARAALCILRSLHAQSLWSPLISKIASSHLTLLGSAIPAIARGNVDPDQLFDLMGVLRLFSSDADVVTHGARVRVSLSRKGADQTDDVGTVVDISRTKAWLIRDNDITLQALERDVQDLHLVPDTVYFGDLLLTRQALSSLLALVVLRPTGSTDRRKSNADCWSGSAAPRGAGPETALVLSQLQSCGLKVVTALLGCMPSLIAQDTLSTIVATPANVLQLLQIARMPIPLHETPDIKTLEQKCVRLAQSVQDQQCIDVEARLASGKKMDKEKLRQGAGEHIDWCSKAVQIFHNEPDAHRKAMDWLRVRRSEVDRAEANRNNLLSESMSPKSKAGDILKRLSALGFPVALCERALQLNKGNEIFAANWLMDYGIKELESSPPTLEVLAPDSSPDSLWSVEGVDHFQEMGDGDVALDLMARAPSDMVDGNFESFSDAYNRLALEPTRSRQQNLFSDLKDDRTKSRNSKPSLLQRSCLRLTIGDVRVGQTVRISSSWVSARNHVLGKVGSIAGTGRASYRWYLNSVQNTWEPFDDNVTAQLEERWRQGESFCAAILDSEPFMFRLDRMAMYHSLTGYMVRLRRRRIEKAVASPFQRVSSKPADDPDSTARRDGSLVDPDSRRQQLLDALSPLQLVVFEQVQAVVPDTSRHWIVQALHKTAFNANAAVEWLFANASSLEAVDQEYEAKWNATMMLTSAIEATATDSESDLSAYAGILDFGDALVTVRAVDVNHGEVWVTLPLEASDSGFSQCSASNAALLCPIDALEWVDSWLDHHMPNEISKRRKLGARGLLTDTFAALAIVYARRAVLMLMHLALQPSNHDSADGDDGLSLAHLNLKVTDVISILKLMANDAPGGYIHEGSSSIRDGFSIWYLLRALSLHPKYASEMMSFLIDDCILHLRKSSSRVFETATSHPYPDATQTKEEVYIENASELVVEFDRRSQLKEGHAMVSFWSDPECSQEIALMSGSGFQSLENPTGSGFRSFVVKSNRFFITFGSGQSRPNGKVEFGYALRVRPVGYRFEDERDILKAPLGWPLLSLLTSADLVNSCISHPNAPNLVVAVMRYLRCLKSPSKVYTTMALEKLFMAYPDWISPRKENFFELIGGKVAFFHLQTIRDKIRDFNTRAPAGSLFSPFLKALEDLLRAVRLIFPVVAFQTCEVELPALTPSSPSINPWEIRAAIGKSTGVDIARVEHVLKALHDGRRLPSVQVIALAYEHLNSVQLLRLCLKELETSIKLNKQVSKWKDDRRFWMSMVNTFKDVDYLADILLMLRRSMLDSAFEPMWSFRQKDWEARVREARTFADYALCLRDLEEAFRWRDEKDDNRESALVTSWRASRPNWLKTIGTLGEEAQLSRVQATLPSPQEAERSPYWTRDANEQLVAFLDAMIIANARRLRSLTFIDITEPRAGDVQLWPALRGIPLPHLRSRFAVLKMINQLVAAIMVPIAALWNMESRSVGSLLRGCKKLLFLEAKLAILTQAVQRMYSKEKDPQNVVLNRHEAAKERSLKPLSSRVLTPLIRHSIFYQLYSQLRLVDSEALRRKGQAWRVKFVGERGHDVGGLFNASLSNVCDELMSSRLPLFIPTPNAKHRLGEQREKWMPNPAANDPQHFSWFEFVGRLMGIACLSQNRTLSIDLPSIVWKTIVREDLDLTDLKIIDYSVHRIIQLMRHPEIENITVESFEFAFSDLFFTIPSATGGEIELLAGGSAKPVTWQNRLEYADAIEMFRLRETDAQIGAVCRGLAQILPVDLLVLFSWQQFEVLVCGSPDVDIQLLKEKTIYAGSVKEGDTHIQMFWRVIESFSAADRREFLQFVWGRSRLPTTKVGFGKDAFKISDHSAAVLASGSSSNPYAHDPYLPVAHTCFFALELPRYSSDAIMAEKLLYAIHNCKTIDADTTQESAMNLNMNWSDGESDDEQDNSNSSPNDDNQDDRKN